MALTKMELTHVMYTPTHDALQRHKNGVSKHRKSLSTGGGRAWSDNEEAYLLQTRLRKMPYKHIAAQLNKTELACRLHYHQISHGSNRRKRNLSCSSVPTDYSLLFREQPGERESRLSPASQVEDSRTASPSSGVRLPSIVSAETSPQLPAILPKPNTIAPKPEDRSRGCPQGQGLVPSAGFEGPHAPKQALKLDTALPSVSAPSHNSTHVDLARLHAVYTAHRNAFWTAIASEYGKNASPLVLEQAWKTGKCCGQKGHSPITPSASPASETREGFGDRGQDRTSISSILGPDAGARSAWDRDMIRKMEVVN